MSKLLTNADVVRQAYQAFNEADLAALDRCFGDDATWTTPGDSTVAGTARGKNAVFTQFGRYGGETSGTFKAQLQAVFETEDGRVIGLHRNVGERDGNKLDTMCSLLLEVSDEQIKSGTEYFLDLQNWDRFWS